ncbi:MAG TPA: dihydrolipoyl dehydrogenase [Solirubrobacteraceae bacterium]|nr:dihydrolipoyl dehydrogenase [Solirubrobacteraceae bacterium]
MATATYDCIVIGSGPGGYVAAIRAAQLGMSTVCIEKEAIGGRCLNVACIPAKAVLRSADVAQEIRDAGEFGILTGEPVVDFAKVMERRDSVVGTLTGGVGMLLKKHKIDVIEGAASLTAAGTVTVGDQELEATKAIVLATGSVPRSIPGTSFGGRVIGTEEAWSLRELPARLAVVGAGASGTEIASAYARLGSQVQLFEGLDRVLPGEDADISKIAARAFKKQGIEVHTKTFVSDVQSGADGVTFAFGEDGRGEADWLVIATGRAPDVEGLGLEAAGVKLAEDGLIEVDGMLRTSAPRVYAIGDLVLGPALAHKSSEEGVIAVEHAAGHDPRPLSYPDIPRATFCLPNVGSFGLTEAQAKQAGHDVVVGKVPYGVAGATTVYGDRSGIVKLVGDRTYGELLGAHIVGAKAADMIQELVNTRLLEGGYPEVATMVHGHPTFSEAVLEAARAADGWLIQG